MANKYLFILFLTLICLVNTVTAVSTCPYDDVKAYWSFDNETITGVNIEDISSNSYNLMQNFTTISSGGLIEEYLNVSTNESTAYNSSNLGGEFKSIVMAFKSPPVVGEYGMFMLHNNNNTEERGDITVMFNSQAEVRVNLYHQELYTGCGNRDEFYSTTGALDNNNWNILVLTTNGTWFKLYLNGELEESTDIYCAREHSKLPFGFGNESSGQLYLGRAYGANNQYWLGFIDEFSIYETELSAADVTYITDRLNSGFGLTPKSLNFTFYNQADNELVKDVTFDVITDVSSANYSTTNGTYEIKDVYCTSEITVRYRADGFLERFYYLDLSAADESVINFDLYLINESGGANVTATVYDFSNKPVEGAYIKVLKYDVSTNTYILQEVATTNFEGKTFLHLSLNDEYYKFILEYPIDDVRRITSPTYIYNTDITFQIAITNDVGTDFFNTINGVTSDLSFSNASNKFILTYTTTEDYTLFNFDVYRLTGMGKTLYNSTSTSNKTSSLNLAVFNTSGAKYVAEFHGTTGEGDKYLIDTLIYEYEDISPTGKLGLFLVVILMVMFAFFGVWSRAVALILTPIPLIIGSATNLIDISLAVAIPIEIVCIIIAIWLDREG